MEVDEKTIDTVCENLDADEAECEKQSEIQARYGPPDDDEDFDDRRPDSEPFDVDALFSDL